MVGAPYYTALRLVAFAQDHWTAIDGEAAQRGVDYFSLSFDRFLNAIQWWVMQRVKDPERFEADLNEPPRQIGAPVTDRELEADASAFMAFAGALGVTPPQPGQAVPSDGTASGG